MKEGLHGKETIQKGTILHNKRTIWERNYTESNYMEKDYIEGEI